MKWPTQISVDKRIVQILSGNTYQNFPQAIRELVANSYDADAPEVNITINESRQNIIVSDTGSGMTENDMDFYFRIAGRRREKAPQTKSGRFIVGQFGVGFLAVFPFCREFRIESKRKGSKEAVVARIPTARYFTSDNRLMDVDEIMIEGGTINCNESEKEKSYTKIELKGFTQLTDAYFKGSHGAKYHKNSIVSLNGLDRLIWQLEENLPLPYEDQSIEEILKSASGIPLRVVINGKDLRRRTYGKSILEKHKGSYQEFGKIKCRYVILSDYKAVSPEEARFLKIRNLNVGVGDRENFGVGAKGPRSRLQHLSGEILILEGMNDLISVSRNGFNYSSDYEEMKEFFAARLRALNTQLEVLDDLSNLSVKNKVANRVSDVRLLKQVNMRKKVDRLEKSGFQIRSVRAKISPAPASVEIDKENKVITIPADAESLYANVMVRNTIYSLKLDAWDWESESLYPACRINNKTIVINQNYPLFKQRKYTDIFIKFHVMLIEENNKGNLPQNVFRLLQDNLLDYFKDYIQGVKNEID